MFNQSEAVNTKTKKCKSFWPKLAIFEVGSWSKNIFRVYSYRQTKFCSILGDTKSLLVGSGQKRQVTQMFCQFSQASWGHTSKRRVFLKSASRVHFRRPLEHLSRPHIAQDIGLRSWPIFGSKNWQKLTKIDKTLHPLFSG